MIRATAAAAAAVACIDAQQNASTYRCRACGTTPRRRPDEHSEGGLQDSLAAGAAAGEVSLRVLQWSHMELARARK